MPFQVEAENADIEIRIQWVSRLGRPVRRPLFDSGATWQLYEDVVGFQFDVSAPVFGEEPYKRLLVDRFFRKATLQISQEAFETFPCLMQSLDYPLDELLIMHRLTQEKAIEMHGSGIVRRDGVGNLFVGHSGAGKSTTTSLWTAREDVEVLSDDRIIVRRDAPRLEAPRQDDKDLGGHKVIRLRDCSDMRTNRYRQADGAEQTLFSEDYHTSYKMRMYGTPWHGEGMYASPNSAPLARIFVLEHGRGNVVTPLSRSQAVAELIARSFVPFHRHEYVESALEFLEEVVATVPVYRYAFEPNQGAVDTILSFHDYHQG